MEDTFLGIEIGGTKIQIFICNENGNVLSKFRTGVGEIKEASEIRRSIKKIITSEITPVYYNIKSAGIGFGGPVDIINGTIYNSFHVEGWRGFNLANWLSNIIDAPVYIENDANLAALAEASKGAGKDTDRVFYMTIGSGIGGGFVINKSIYHGHKKGEAEVGHIRLLKEGSTLEAACSGWAIDKKIRDALQIHPNSKIAHLINGQSGSEARFLKTALQNKCEIASQIFNELTDNIAFGLSHVIHLINPDKIIIGGGLSLIGEILVDSIKSKIPDYLMDILCPGPEITLSELNEDVVVVGALVLAIENYKSYHKK